MIYKTSDKAIITALWQESFGDSEEEIRLFLENVRHAECLVDEEAGEAAAMLFLVDCCLHLKKGKYIYAACTAARHRGKGYMTKLLEYCIVHEQLLCLIPGDDGLVKYYEQRGFHQRTAIDNLSFDEKTAICEYLLDGFQLTDPCVLYVTR